MAYKKLEGTVEHNDPIAGTVVIGGKTLGAAPNTRAWVAQMREGDYVGVSYDDENMIRYVEKGNPQKKETQQKIVPVVAPVQFSDKDRIIVRQNALAHADAAMNNGWVKGEDEYFSFAERIERWTLR